MIRASYRLTALDPRGRRRILARHLSYAEMLEWCAAAVRFGHTDVEVTREGGTSWVSGSAP